MLMLTTTAIDVDEELLNRCLVLSVNETREQTQAIHALQRHKQTLEGFLAENEKEYITQLHQNAQRLLKPFNVVNPYAHQLTFLSDKTRTRRDHMKYLTLIQAITLLHQYQRPIKQVSHRGQTLEYIEVTKDDIALANQLAHEVLGRTLDEMPPQTRKLLNLLQVWVSRMSAESCVKAAEYRFTRRDVRDETHWGDTQLKVHLNRLVEMEYLLLFRRGLTYEYSLLYDGQDNKQNHLCGLLKIENLTNNAGNVTQSDLVNGQAGQCRAQVGGVSESLNSTQSQSPKGLRSKSVELDTNAIINGNKKAAQTALPVLEGVNQHDSA